VSLQSTCLDVQVSWSCFIEVPIAIIIAKVSSSPNELQCGTADIRKDYHFIYQYSTSLQIGLISSINFSKELQRNQDDLVMLMSLTKNGL